MCTQDKIGFIGLGAMGEPMARNLLAAGMPLMVWNRSADNSALLAAAGAEVATDLNTLFEQTRTVILMLATEQAVDAVLARGTTTFTARVTEHTLLHMGTVSTGFSSRLEADIRAAGGHYVEAPVSGSRRPAQTAQLVVMLAGDATRIESVEPLLRPLCRQTVRCGEVPNALRMKFATNAFLLPLVAALAEAFHLADGFGLDRQQFLSVINGGQMASPISRIKAEKLAADDFAVQAAVSDALKNNRLAAGTAREAGIACPLLDVCAELYAETEALGLGPADLSAVIKALEQRSQGPH